MAKILITSGPTRQYLDPVRYISNASSGRMGAALARAALDLGHDVTIISGPVTIDYPDGATIVPVVTTDEMLEAATHHFQSCDGAIGAAAPCDYMPRFVNDQKIAKTGEPLTLQLVETPDIVATLGQNKTAKQWVVGFALETEDRRFRATVKLEKKHCDLIVSNGPSAIDSDENEVELIGRDGTVLLKVRSDKSSVASALVKEIDARLIRNAITPNPN
ncbi:phosphopantothenoylcysteine decarboxylase [Stieleria sp. JC731]|uniref:phosphopantothenoylcysteine decarboxylase domain-containing protein n=1 Tax=Pirellulaceae TaxID=2691357 RepID=UPI001E5A43EC|nr:phosphopantothenoylcysteine decarboxylase [Stieleria sp. JC731]MCC9601753.1 phosphopantothenoylcysteine decarboxylase [Stieleria sp. JC731]